jgi:hypothetical protein
VLFVILTDDSDTVTWFDKICSSHMFQSSTFHFLIRGLQDQDAHQPQPTWESDFAYSPGDYNYLSES